MTTPRTSRVPSTSAVRCEPLESRQLLSGGSAALDHGILRVEGTRHDDRLEVSIYTGKQGQRRVRATIGPRELGTFLARDVKGVVVRGGLGADTLWAVPIVEPVAGQLTLNNANVAGGVWLAATTTETAFPIPVTLSGGAGKDNLTGGGGDDRLDGGSGDDTITGNGGDDEIFGRDGNDKILGGDGHDTIHGGDGADDVDGSGTRYIYSGGTNAGGTQFIKVTPVTTRDPEADDIYGDAGRDTFHKTDAGAELIDLGSNERRV